VLISFATRPAQPMYWRFTHPAVASPAFSLPGLVQRPDDQSVPAVAARGFGQAGCREPADLAHRREGVPRRPVQQPLRPVRCLVVMRHWLRHPVTTAEEAHQVIQARRADRRAGTGFSFAALEAHADGAAGDLVGGVSIRGLASEAASGEVGYWVTAPSPGRGIAPRALNAACKWAFRLPGIRPLEKLELIHDIGNHASCRVAEKTGFALSAVLRPLPPEFPNDGHLHIRSADKPPVITQTRLCSSVPNRRLPY
jgi:RimJ/RimL family protein N-acetyltransferase